MNDLDDLDRLREGVLVIANEIHRQAMTHEVSAVHADDWQDRLRSLLPDHMAEDWTFIG